LGIGVWGLKDMATDFTDYTDDYPYKDLNASTARWPAESCPAQIRMPIDFVGIIRLLVESPNKTSCTVKAANKPVPHKSNSSISSGLAAPFQAKANLIATLFLTAWIVFIALIPVRTSCQDPTLHRYEFSEYKMGTQFRLIFYCSSDKEAQNISNKAFMRIDELNDIFSDYEEKSEVNRLSTRAGSGEEVKVSDELWDVLSLSQKVSEKSNGAFDVTIGPATKLWRRAIRRQEYPDSEAIKQAQSLVKWRCMKLNVEAKTVELTEPGMRIDLGGIAKGYTVDEVFKLFKANGIERVLIDGGGDIFMGEAPPGKNGWKVHPLEEQGGIHSVSKYSPLRCAVVPLSETNSINRKNRNHLSPGRYEAIAGTGITYQNLKIEETVYSHVVNPKSGEGVKSPETIYVRAPNCALADALATALSATSPKHRQNLISKFEDCEILFVPEN